VILVVLALLGVGALMITSAHASLTTDSQAIAKVGMPLGGGTIESVTVVTGPHSQRVPVVVRGDRIYPVHLIPANQQLTIDVVVKRPGWNAWLAGRTEKLHLALTTPVASLRSHYLTVGAHAPLLLHFKQPIEVYSYGQPGHLRRHVLATPQAVVPLPRSTSAGTIFVAAVPRRWESSHESLVSWFPTGAAATAVANPAPGSTIKPATPITLTFSKPVSKALGSHLPPLSPATPGHWRTLNSHSLVFQPQGYGYGLAAKVHIALPSGVRLVGGQSGSSASGGTWTVPGGSTLRLQQLLALLNYLPLKFHYAGGGVGLSPAAEEAAAIKPPAGKFSWRYRNIPAALRGFWQPGASGVVTRGAVMAFENDHGMTPDGTAGPAVWKALIAAVLAGHRSTFGYTFVSVSEGSPETEQTWHNGRIVVSGAVNTGIPSAPTATGTYPVFEHSPSVTMSGTNPDGSHYSDPGVPYVSYFNGGDALHGFLRASYGSAQSLGCVEMPYSEAGAVYPYTPVGTLVHVT
jgi:peptidoglycan hydrolase-like protein with peptidoglycan-binding domain